MISVIIPVLNEEDTIEKTLSELDKETDVEVIVVDGGSTDRTCEIVRKFNCRLIESQANRAVQMNIGAKAAKGDNLIFLHSDCILENGSIKAVEKCLSNGFLGGCLTHKILSPNLIFRFIEVSGNIRAALLRIFYGDQAIFVRRTSFFSLGMFEQVDILEDVKFSKALKKIGKTCILKNKVFVSARRWKKLGVIKTTFINWIVSVGFAMGVPLNKLKALYKNVR
ncbi:MAG: TIGR04283 family arsenosugar biosynthesis glycosyltransferase [Candidatus Omnitrophica bacterium]|nr:TIGR04283 family arsenosugar biosynthesis glycosyltransferase [Candidatus Omnitrophota bacterium]MBU1997048.1 TIGR04283 family arsenosugar biosynthesis glycosyltransferase [Candidatus Omnitrophota bacterium]MBU4334751.1 TIGR04283 family arsenosugar biosynthesis glycosyltransferase [Candidatus Omnitrophota bacterium]